MRVRYWREGELEREEEERAVGTAEELAGVRAVPMRVMAGNPEMGEQEPRQVLVVADQYKLVGAIQHSKVGVMGAEYVYVGSLLTKGCAEWGGGCG